MSRARNIKPSFFVNDDLAEVDPFGRLLFIGLWTIADREGRMEDRPKRIKAEILPYDSCDVDALLNELQSHGFIIRYESDGKRYIQVINFKKHQNPHIKEAESIIPPPCSNDAEKVVDNHCVVEAPDKHCTSTVQEHGKHTTNPADSLLLIPDSLNLIPESAREERLNVRLAKAFNSNMVRCQASDPRVIALAEQGVTPDVVTAACEEALSKKPNEKIPIGYVLKIIETWAKRACTLSASGAKAPQSESWMSFLSKRNEVVINEPDTILLG